VTPSKRDIENRLDRVEEEDEEKGATTLWQESAKKSDDLLGNGRDEYEGNTEA
jgi:hypothetical protein